MQVVESNRPGFESHFLPPHLSGLSEMMYVVFSTVSTLWQMLCASYLLSLLFWGMMIHFRHSERRTLFVIVR